MTRTLRPAEPSSPSRVRSPPRGERRRAEGPAAQADAQVRDAPAVRGAVVVDQAPDLAGREAFVGGRPAARRDARPEAPLDGGALAAVIRGQEWFGEADKPIASVQVQGQREIETADRAARHLLVDVQVRFEDGSKQRYLAPVKVGADGALSDALSSQPFKDALLEGVARGERFEPASAERPASTARRRPASGAAGRGAVGAQLAAARLDKAARGPLEATTTDPKREAAALARAVYEGANNPWRALVDKGYTTRERYEHVVAQAKKLSPENADALVVEFMKNVYRTLEAQTPEIKAFHEALQTKPRFGPVMYGYAQFMGVEKGRTEGTFDDLIRFLEVAQGPAQQAAGALGSMVRGDEGAKGAGLGFRDVELLPFFQSPMKDGGYDISDHAAVMLALGGTEAYARFMAEAVKRGVRVTADLVANHVSDEHAWVKALKAGDESMLSRFVVWDDAVKVGERVVDGKTFNVFLHTKGEHAGKISHVWQIFPDNNPDTFIDVEVNGKKHKVFASFMNPYQWDVNGADPQVLSHYLSVIGQFANMGQMGTRMDAIIHMGKTPGTFNMNEPASQAFMALAKAFASHVAPGNMFLPEANLDWQTANRDWVAPEAKFDGKVENTAGDALISFDAHRAIWRALLTGDKSAWVEVQNALGDLPPHKSVMVYLSLHDETLVEKLLEDPEMKALFKAKGFSDFAGRGLGDSAMTLLGDDPKRLAMAHVLLYGSKGHPAVYYRNVVGAKNDDAFFQRQKEARLADQKAAGQLLDPTKATDTRDLDRGPVALEDFERALQEGLEPAVTIRALNALWDAHGAVRTNRIDEVKTPDESVVAFARRATDTDDPPLLQLVNLEGAAKTVEFDLAEIGEKLGWSSLQASSLHDLLAGEITGKASPASFRVEDGKLKIELQPYQAVYLEQSERGRGV